MYNDGDGDDGERMREGRIERRGRWEDGRMVESIVIK